MNFDTVFQPLRAAMSSHPFVISDVFDLIALTHHQGNQVVAQALTLHARNYSMECEAAGTSVNPGALLAEMYWRTYFDELSSKLTQTYDILGGDLNLAQQMVAYLHGSLQMDLAATDSGFPVIIPDYHAGH